MQLFSSVSDNNILLQIKNGDILGWEQLYDKYATHMLTMICKLTATKEKGEEILIELFTAKKFETFLNTLDSKLVFHLGKYAFTYAAVALKDQGLVPLPSKLARLPEMLLQLYKEVVPQVPKLTSPAPSQLLGGTNYKWLPIFGINAYA